MADAESKVRKPMGVTDDLATKFVRKLAPELKEPHPRFPSFSSAVKVYSKNVCMNRVVYTVYRLGA